MHCLGLCWTTFSRWAKAAIVLERREGDSGNDWYFVMLRRVCLAFCSDAFGCRDGRRGDGWYASVRHRASQSHFTSASFPSMYSYDIIPLDLSRVMGDIRSNRP